jgi:hypothetical protein
MCGQRAEEREIERGREREREKEREGEREKERKRERERLMTMIMYTHARAAQGISFVKAKMVFVGKCKLCFLRSASFSA